MNDAESENAKATFENGILTVSLPAPESKQRRRQVPIEARKDRSEASNLAGTLLYVSWTYGLRGARLKCHRCLVRPRAVAIRQAEPDTSQRTLRSPFPRWIPRTLKREPGRAHAVPVHIRVLGADLNTDTRRYIRQKLSRALGKFAQSIERVTVRVKDANGPPWRHRQTFLDQSGADQASERRCRNPARLLRCRAFRNVLARTERAVRKNLQRSRIKPRKRDARRRMVA